MVRVLPAAESAKFRTAFCVPIAKGLNLTVTVQLPYGVTTVPHALVWLYSDAPFPVIVMPFIVSLVGLDQSPLTLRLSLSRDKEIPPCTILRNASRAVCNTYIEGVIILDPGICKVISPIAKPRQISFNSSRQPGTNISDGIWHPFCGHRLLSNSAKYLQNIIMSCWHSLLRDKVRPQNLDASRVDCGFPCSVLAHNLVKMQLTVKNDNAQN
jgi:hypothetical protein